MTAAPRNDVLLALRRRLWVGGVALALAIILAGGIYLLALRHSGYVATQVLVVSVLPPDGGGASAALAARQLAAQAARDLAAGTPLTGPAFTGAVQNVVRASGTTALDTAYGSGAFASLAPASGPELAAALSATHAGDRMTLSARWSTPGGARALVGIAGQVLSAHPELLFVGSTGSPTLDGATGRVLLDGPVSAASRDPAQQAAARARLLWSLLLGMAGALTLTLLLAWWDVRTTDADVSAVPGDAQAAPRSTPEPSAPPPVS